MAFGEVVILLPESKIRRILSANEGRNLAGIFRRPTARSGFAIAHHEAHKWFLLVSYLFPSIGRSCQLLARIVARRGFAALLSSAFADVTDGTVLTIDVVAVTCPPLYFEVFNADRQPILPLPSPWLLGIVVYGSRTIKLTYRWNTFSEGTGRLDERRYSAILTITADYPTAISRCHLPWLRLCCR